VDLGRGAAVYHAQHVRHVKRARTGFEWWRLLVLLLLAPFVLWPSLF
jgi:hypothetical protein